MTQNPDVQIDRLLGLLDNEIQGLDDERVRPGWTIWALLVAICAFFWQLMPIIGSPAFHLFSIIRIVIGLSLLADGVFVIVMALRKQTTSLSDRFAHPSSNERLPTNLLGLLFLRNIALLIAFLIAASDYSALVSSLFYSCLSVEFLILIGNLLLIVTNAPTPRQLRRSLYVASQMLHISYSVILFVGGVSFLGSTGFWQTISQETLQGAPLITGIIYLLLLLSYNPRGTRLRAELVRLRRQLALGHITFEQARLLVDTTLLGLRLEHILSGAIAEYISSSNSFVTRAAELQTELATTKHLLAQSDSIDAALLKMKTAYSQLEGIREAEEKLVKHIARLRKGISRLVFFSPESSRSAVEIHDAILKHGAQAMKSFDGIREEFSKLERQISALHSDSTDIN